MIAVANLSLGCVCESAAVDAAIAGSVAKGVVYVVAAGNEGIDAANDSPASQPDVITVSALSDFDVHLGASRRRPASPTSRTTPSLPSRTSARRSNSPLPEPASARRSLGEATGSSAGRRWLRRTSPARRTARERAQARRRGASLRAASAADRERKSRLDGRLGRRHPGAAARRRRWKYLCASPSLRPVRIASGGSAARLHARHQLEVVAQFSDGSDWALIYRAILRGAYRSNARVRALPFGNFRKAHIPIDFGVKECKCPPSGEESMRVGLGSARRGSLA
jgi:hypothetical protein